MALVLTIKDTDGPIWIGEDIKISLVFTDRRSARLAIEAPDDVEILRDSLKNRNDRIKEKGNVN